MRRRLTRATAFASAVAASAALVVLPARAEAPPVLSGPDSSWSTSGTIAEPHLQAACAADPSAPSPLTEAACPTFELVLDAPDTATMRYLDVRLDMTAVAAGRTVEDYDLYLYAADGTEVSNSANALGGYEVMSVNHIAEGTYTVKVVPYTNVPDSKFTLTARFRTATR